MSSYFLENAVFVSGILFKQYATKQNGTLYFVYSHFGVKLTEFYF